MTIRDIDHIVRNAIAGFLVYTGAAMIRLGYFVAWGEKPRVQAWSPQSGIEEIL